MRKKHRRKRILFTLGLAMVMMLQPIMPTAANAFISQTNVTQHTYYHHREVRTPARLSSSRFLASLAQLDYNGEVDVDALELVDQVEIINYDDEFEPSYEEDEDEDDHEMELEPSYEKDNIPTDRADELEEALGNVDVEAVEIGLEENGVAFIDGWVLFDSNGNELPQSRTSPGQVRHLGYVSNTSFNFAHIPGYPGTLAYQGVGMWEAWFNGRFVTAFCIEPGIQSVTGGNQTGGWGTNQPSGAAFSQLSVAQQNTISFILLHGYGNIHGFTNDTDNSARVATQIAIWEVVLGAWTWQTPWNGSIPNTGVVWDMNRRLIQPSGSMIGGTSHQVAIGTNRRRDMYNRIRQDINDFHRLGTVPQFARPMPASQAPVHLLTWSNTNQRFQVTLSDTASSGGNQLLSRFLGNRTSGSFGQFNWSRTSPTSNTMTVYTTNPNASRTTSPASLLNIQPPNSTPLVWWHHPTLQDKVSGFEDPFLAFFAVEIDTTSAQVQKRSDHNGAAIPDTVFELQRQNVNTGGWHTTSATTTTDANGNATFTGLLSGRRYRIREVSVPAPYLVDSMWREFTAVSGQTTTLRWYNERAVGEITVRKNSEIGDVLPGTVYRITGNGINRIGTTNANGYVVFGDLPLAATPVTYTIVEETVPAPHVLDPTPMTVTLSRINQTTAVTRTSVAQVNDLARGRVNIEKLGNVIVGFEPYEFQDTEPTGLIGRLLRPLELALTNNDEQAPLVNSNPPHLTGGLMSTPRQGIRWIFEDLPIEGVTFNVYAREDIVLFNGSVLHSAGEFVGTFITDENGFIESDALHLGRYFVREISAPNGWYIEDVEVDFELTYADQYTAIVFDDLEIENQWQGIHINILKLGEVFGGSLEFTDEFIPIEGVQYGLFAGEDFTFLDGSVLEKGTLIKDGFTDEFGELQFSTYLPLGDFYIQEMAVVDFYVIDDTKHFFTHTGDTQDVPVVEIIISELDGIKNHFLRGSFELIKISRDLPIVDDGILGTEVENDDVDGEQNTDAEGEVLDISDITDVDLDELETPTPEIDPIDEEQVLLQNVSFELWNLDLSAYVGTFITDENGRIYVSDLIYGNYRLHETVADVNHQLLSEPIYFTIDREHQQFNFTVANYKTNTQILKVDHEDNPLAGAHLYIKTVDVAGYEDDYVVEEWVSTLEAHQILGLAHGNYELCEAVAPAGFALLEDCIPFTVADAEETIYLTAVNLREAENMTTPLPETGAISGIATWIVGVGLLACAGVIIKIERKKKQNEIFGNTENTKSKKKG